MAKLYVGAHEERVFTLLNARRFVSFIEEHNYQTQYCVGADLSMNGTGFVCCTQDNDVKLVKTFSNKVVPYTRSSIALYLNDLSKLVQSFCSQMREADLPATGADPTKVLLVYEEVNVGSNFTGMLGVARSQAASLVGWANGVGARSENDILAVPVSNLQIKKVLGGHKKSTKEDLMALTLKNFGHNFKDDNQADAFGASLIGIALIMFAHEVAASDLSPHMSPKDLRDGFKELSDDWHERIWEVAESQFKKSRFFASLGLRKVNDQISKEFLQLGLGKKSTGAAG